MDIYTETVIIHDILSCCKSCDCNKDQYDRGNALWLWNPKNHLCENMAPSLPQSLCRGLRSFQSLPQCLGRGLSSSRSLLQPCTKIPAAPKFVYCNSQSRSILNAPPRLQVLSGGRENALPQSESTLQSCRGGWEHLEVLSSSCEVYWSVWEVCVWLPDRITFC
jgi:hypothetical protein